MNPKDIRAFRLRNKTIEDLQNTLDEHRKELSDLRVNKVASGVASKLAKLRVVRKAIARILTIMNEKRRKDLKESFKTRKGIRAYNEANKTSFSLNKVPKELRPRLTRTLRKKITKKQQSKLLVKQAKRVHNFPVRSFALKA